MASLAAIKTAIKTVPPVVTTKSVKRHLGRSLNAMIDGNHSLLAACIHRRAWLSCVPRRVDGVLLLSDTFITEPKGLVAGR